MKKLILYTSLFLCPFIVSIVCIEIMLRRIPNNYMIKGSFLKKGSSDVKIIILGSSHGIIGIDPDGFSKKAFNIANYSQTLDIDYEILNKYHEKIDSLEYIILTFSYHSLWTKLEGGRNKYYNIYYDINSERNPLKLFLFQDTPIRFNLEKIKNHYFSNLKPKHSFTNQGYDKTATTESLDKIKKHVELVIAKHEGHDLTLRNNQSVEYLRKIIELAKKRNAKILLVTTPSHSLWVECFDQKQLNMMYSVTNELVDNKDVFYYNGLNDFNITEADKNNFKLFSDADHLSHIGATRFTQKLDSIIREIENKEINTPEV